MDFYSAAMQCIPVSASLMGNQNSKEKSDIKTFTAVAGANASLYKEVHFYVLLKNTKSGCESKSRRICRVDPGDRNHIFFYSASVFLSTH